MQTKTMKSDLAYLDTFYDWTADEKKEIWIASTQDGKATDEAADWWHRMARAYRFGYRIRMGRMVEFERKYIIPYMNGDKSALEQLKNSREKTIGNRR